MKQITENQVQEMISTLGKPIENEQRAYEFADLAVYINDFTFSDNSMLRMIGKTNAEGTIFEYYTL